MIDERRTHNASKGEVAVARDMCKFGGRGHLQAGAVEWRY